LAQTIGYIVGAATQTGFRGIAGRFSRQNLLVFDPSAQPFGSVTFTRLDNGDSVRVSAFSERLPAAPEMPLAMRQALAGDAKASAVFKAAWAKRVAAVIENPDLILETQHCASARSEP
jgi:hypothetical protein